MDADRKITITFSSTSGDFTDDFPANQPLKAAKRQAMIHLQLDPSQASEFVVVQNGVNLDETKSLKELGLSDGVILLIERKELVKI